MSHVKARPSEPYQFGTPVEPRDVADGPGLILGALQVGGTGQTLLAIHNATKSWAHALIANGAFAAVDVDVPGAKVGSPVFAGADSLPDGCVLSGVVKTADVVRVSLLNFSGASLAAGTTQVAVAVVGFAV